MREKEEKDKDKEQKREEPREISMNSSNISNQRMSRLIEDLGN